MNRPKPQLFSLLVGINTYRYARSLCGPIYDVQNIQNYLQEPFVRDKFEEIKTPQVLLNEQATKEAIVNAWESSFGDANKGDVCFFFFAGHGARELTSLKPFAHSEIDQRIESLACYDSKVREEPEGDMSKHVTLADKELRYLIYPLAQKGIRVVCVFDCCHSGDNTRDLKKVPDHARQEGRFTLAERDYAGFLFADKIKKERFEREPLENILPLGEHVQYAACRDVELAYEVPPEKTKRNGVFTQALLKVLRRHEGNISFHDLFHQVAHAMPQNSEMLQRPQFFMPVKDKGERFQEFLSFATMGAERRLSLVHNPDTQEWRMSLGGLHGVYAQTEVSVMSLENSEDDIPAKIISIFPSYTVIQFSSRNEHPVERYMVKVRRLAIRPLEISFVKPDKKNALYKPLFEQLNGQKEADENSDTFFNLTSKAQTPDYELRLANGELWLCKPRGKRPVIKPYAILPANPIEGVIHAKSFLAEIQQVAQWHYFKDLELSQTVDPVLTKQFPLEFRLYQKLSNGKEKYIEPIKDGFSLHLLEDRNSNDPYTYIRLELINRSSVPLFCAVLYLSMDYQIHTGLMNKETEYLEPGAIFRSKPIGDPSYMRYSFFYEHILKDRWLAKEDYFKVIASETPFGTAEFAKSALPMRYQAEMRNIGGIKPRSLMMKPSWMVKTYELQALNPHLHLLPKELGVR